MNADPAQHPVTAFSDGGISQGAFPLPLPVDENINGIDFDDDPIDCEIQRDLLKALKVLADVNLQTLKRIEWQHNSLNIGEVLLDIRSAKRFHCGLIAKKFGLL